MVALLAFFFPKARQTAIRQEQDKVRVLEEALQVLAREHHQLEQSVICDRQQSNANNPNVSMSLAASEMFSIHRSLSSRIPSYAALSETTADEYFDAFDDLDDGLEEDTLDASLCSPDSNSATDILADSFKGISQLVDQNEIGTIPLTSPLATSFHTARDGGTKSAGAIPSPLSDECTLNDSISTLSPDVASQEEDATIADEIENIR